MKDISRIEQTRDILEKYLEKTRLMLVVIKAGDFDAFEALIAERQKLINQHDGVPLPNVPEISTLVSRIKDEQDRVNVAFSAYREDVEREYNDNKRNIKVAEFGKKVENVYQSASLGIGGIFDYKK